MNLNVTLNVYNHLTKDTLRNIVNTFVNVFYLLTCTVYIEDTQNMVHYLTICMKIIISSVGITVCKTNTFQFNNIM